jgi:Domain of unknown function (DUF4249)
LKTLRVICLLLSVNLLNCREPFNPPVIQAKNNWLVVDGYIDPGMDSCYIQLSRSQSLSDSNYTLIPENGATVSVLGSNHEQYFFVNLGNGLFGVSELNMSLSETWQLSIVTSNGEQYLSDSLTPSVSPPIDSLPWLADSTGVNIYLNTHDPTGNAKYYKWDFTETWERQAAFGSLLEYVGNELIFRAPQNEIYTCYKTQNSSSLLVGSSTKLSQDVIYMQPIQFIPMGGEQMVYEYSILVRQIALDYNAYLYWQALLGSTELTGSLFEPQPGQVTGNIHSVTNPKETVFGSVSVSTATTKRIFISRSQIPYWVYQNPQCVLMQVDPNDINTFADSLFIVPISQTPSGYTSATIPCGDCRYEGGSNVKPSFWPN